MRILSRVNRWIVKSWEGTIEDIIDPRERCKDLILAPRVHCEWLQQRRKQQVAVNFRLNTGCIYGWILRQIRVKLKWRGVLSPSRRTTIGTNTNHNTGISLAFRSTDFATLCSAALCLASILSRAKTPPSISWEKSWKVAGTIVAISISEINGNNRTNNLRDHCNSWKKKKKGERNEGEEY